MKKAIILIIAILFYLNPKAQIGFAIQWQKALGGNFGADEAHSIIQTTDAGYVIVGGSRSTDGDVTGNYGQYDYWAIKLNSTGTLQWQKNFGGSSNDIAYSIIQTIDGGYLMAGMSVSNDNDVTGNHGNEDYWVVKLSSSGSIQWQKTLGGTGLDRASSIIQTNDGGYAVAGYTHSNDGDVTGNHGGISTNADDYWVVKLSSTGTIQWQKTLGGTSIDRANSIIQTTDGGYAVAGYTHSNDGDVTGNHGGTTTDYWVVKLSNIGTMQWQKTLGGAADDEAYSIIQTTDGGYIVAGSTTSNDGDAIGHHGYWDYWVVKLNNSGTIQWQKTLGGSDGSDLGYSIIQTMDGGYAVAGLTHSNDGDVTGNHDTTVTLGTADYWVVKLSSMGNIQWQKTLGGSGNDEAFSIIQTTDGAYVVAGSTSSDDGDVTGYHPGYTDYWTVKFDTCIIPCANPVGFGIENMQAGSIRVYPNPSDGIFNIVAEGSNDLRVYDVVGREVLKKQIFNSCSVDLSQQLQGVYILQLKTEQGIYTTKLVKD